MRKKRSKDIYHEYLTTPTRPRPWVVGHRHLSLTKFERQTARAERAGSRHEYCAQVKKAKGTFTPAVFSTSGAGYEERG